MLLSASCWIALGLLTGLAAGKLANGRTEGIRADLVLGIGGALFGGWLFKAFAGVGMAGFDVRSLAVAFSGSLVFLVIGRTIRSQQSHA